jgi:YtpI-like protein
MPILVILVIVSFSLYIFYKIRSFMAKGPAERHWITAKGRIALGSFVGIFGVNQLFLTPDTTAYIVSAIFIVIGILCIYTGFKAYKFHLPHAAAEVEAYKKG